MAKQKKGKQAAPPPRTSKRVYQTILVVAVVGAMISIYFFGGRSTSSVGSEGLPPSAPSGVTSTNPALRNRLILPAIPQRPRPITLDPASFPDPEVRASYQAAKDSPEALETVACYCGCYSEAAHRNNLDCYKDNHGVT